MRFIRNEQGCLLSGGDVSFEFFAKHIGKAMRFRVRITCFRKLFVYDECGAEPIYAECASAREA
jgi:hypothetical protein